jgi:hypothetical protein
MFRRKEEVYTVKQFMNRKPAVGFEFKEEMRESLGVLGGISLLPLATKPFFASKPVFAQSVEAVPAIASDVMYDKMLHAFDPLITLVQALAYPVAMVVVLGGALFIMIGNKEKGFSMMSGAALGYVLVNLTPMVLDILVEAMKVI